MQPRLIGYQADDCGLAYTYSRSRLVPDPWHPLVREIKDTIETVTGQRFNSCLLNLYRNGQDKLSWHSDNEPLYGPNPTIASVSFGDPRDFVLRCNEDHAKKRSFPLGRGALLVMGGSTQNHWMHSVPPRARARGPRVNLTFRNIVHVET